MKCMILSSNEVEKYLDVKLAVDTVNYVFEEQGKGNVTVPPKLHLDMSGIGHESWTNSMPAFILPQKVGGIKWVGGFGNNSSQGLPYIMGIVILTDPRNGYVKAIMDGKLISDLRTGASAAIFSRYTSIKQLEKILIVGAGVQGRAAARCLHLEYPDAQIRMFDLYKEKVKIFKEKEAGPSLAEKISICDDLEEGSKGARLIILLTTANKPFFMNEWIEPGTTVLGMGSYQQIDQKFTLSADKIIPDSWSQAKGRGELKPLKEAGLISEENCYSELSEIVAGRMKGRENDIERILCLPVGIGAHDVSIAEIIYQKALKDKEGVFVDIQIT